MLSLLHRQYVSQHDTEKALRTSATISEMYCQYGGYGGFGYSSSARPDDATPPIVKAASLGNLKEIQRLLQQAQDLDDENPDVASPTSCSFPGCTKEPLKSVCKKCSNALYCGDYHKRKHRDEHKNVCGVILPDDVNKRRVMNASKRWTEVDYKASGFSKDYEWHGLTPMAAAASAAKPEVVEYLLKQGADPTLSGCNVEDCHYDALGAAKNSLKSSEAALVLYLNPEQPRPYFSVYSKSQSDSINPSDLAITLLHKLENLKRCVQLLEVASSFWQRNPYSSSHFCKQRHLRGYPENPADLDALTAALDKVSQVDLVERDSEDVSHLAAQIIVRRQREQELRLEAERKRELENNANGNRKKQNRKRFG